MRMAPTMIDGYRKVYTYIICSNCTIASLHKVTVFRAQIRQLLCYYGTMSCMTKKVLVYIIYVACAGTGEPIADGIYINFFAIVVAGYIYQFVTQLNANHKLSL